MHLMTIPAVGALIIVQVLAGMLLPRCALWFVPFTLWGLIIGGVFLVAKRNDELYPKRTDPS